MPDDLIPSEALRPELPMLELVRWLARASLEGERGEQLLAGTCARLVAAGVPIARAFTGVEILHPLLDGQLLLWDAGTGQARQTDTDRYSENDQEWVTSPLYCLRQSGARRLRRSVGGSYREGEFPLVDRLVREGTTDYVAFAERLGKVQAVGERDDLFVTFSTRAPGGFSDACLGALETVLPSLAAAAWTAATRRTLYGLMETYLGRDAGRRVLGGAIERGVGEPLSAVLWFSDLRGFTRLSDSIAPQAIMPMLNAYADAIVSAIHARDGQVLKFMGDGLLAVFPLATQRDACIAALDAALAAEAAVAALNRERAAAALPVTDFYLGLHLGEVLYGNIGSADRLDFTVVGPAVNELSRIAGFCRAVEQTLVVSSAFAEASAAARRRLVSLGRYALRSMARPQELFTLDPEAGA